MNPYSGDMPITIDGQRLTLAYTWDALARLRAELGADGQARALAGDFAALSALIAIGLARHHPDWDAVRITAVSPPVKPTIAAVQAALVAAYFGPEGQPAESAPANPPPPSPTLWRRLWRRLIGRG